MGISRGAVRRVVFRLEGDSRGASRAVSAFTFNLRNLQRAWIAQAKFVDQYKERIDRLGKSNKKQLDTHKQMYTQLGNMTKAWKKLAPIVAQAQRVWVDEFVKEIERSGMTLDEFMRKQAQKDASMDSNIKKAKEAGGRMKEFGMGMQEVGNRIRMAGTRLVGFGRQLTSAGRQMLFFSGILSGVAREMVTDFAEYSGTMADVRGAMLLNQEAGEDLGATYELLRAKVTEVSEDYAYAERDVMKLAQALISGGMSGTQALGLLAKGAEFARANMLEMGQAGELIVRAMTSISVEGMTVADKLDLLTAVGAKTTESLDSIRAAMGFSIESAKKFGEGFEKETIASLVHLIKTGESATVAGRRIQSMFEGLTVNAQNMGFSIIDAKGNFVPFLNIIDRVAMHLNTMGTEIERDTYLNEVFGKNQVLSVKKLVGAREELRMMATQLGFVGGATETLAKIHLSSFEGATESAQSAWQNFRDRLSETIVGPLSDLLGAFEEFLANKEIVGFIEDIADAFTESLIPSLESAFTWLKDTLEELGISGEEIGGVIGGLVGWGLLLGPAMLGMGMAFETLGAALNAAGSAATGLGGIIGGGAGAGVGLIAIITAFALASFWTSDEGKNYFDDIKESASELLNEITREGGLAQSVLQFVANLGMIFGPALSKFIEDAVDSLTLFVKGLDAVFDIINSILEAIGLARGAVDTGAIRARVRRQMEEEYRREYDVRGGEPVLIDEEEYERRVKRAIEAASAAYYEEERRKIKGVGPLGEPMGAFTEEEWREAGLEPYRGEEPSTIFLGWLKDFWKWFTSPEREPHGRYPMRAQFGGRVKRTGWAYVHRGEPILTPEQEQVIKMGLGGGNITINLTMYGLPEGSPYEAGQELGEGLADKIIQRRGTPSR